MMQVKRGKRGAEFIPLFVRLESLTWKTILAAEPSLFPLLILVWCYCSMFMRRLFTRAPVTGIKSLVSHRWWRQGIVWGKRWGKSWSGSSKFIVRRLRRTEKRKREESFLLSFRSDLPEIVVQRRSTQFGAGHVIAWRTNWLLHSYYYYNYTQVFSFFSSSLSLSLLSCTSRLSSLSCLFSYQDFSSFLSLSFVFSPWKITRSVFRNRKKWLTRYAYSLIISGTMFDVFSSVW